MGTSGTNISCIHDIGLTTTQLLQRVHRSAYNTDLRVFTCALGEAVTLDQKETALSGPLETTVQT